MGGRAAPWGSSLPGCKEEQLQAWKIPAWHRHKEQLTVSLQRKCPSHSPDRVSLETSSPLPSSRISELALTKLWAPAVLRAVTLERDKGQLSQSGTCP